MAPEDDNSASKTPDKSNATPQQDNTNKHTSVSKLNDGELKALLDEAITYKNPKDREGKSALFKDLLLEAEENERNARAASAGGSELVRYCNPSAKRRGRGRRSETSRCTSISENVTHGGSLNNLAKEELYEIVSHANRPKKSVSARQKEGGSLPCGVNAGVCGLDRSFLEEEAARQKKEKSCGGGSEGMETERLLEHDALNRDYGVTGEQTMEIVPTRIPRIPVKYTSSAILHVGNDGDVTVSALDNSAPSDKVNETAPNSACTLNANYNVLISGSSIFNNRSLDDKKVDENGNALGGGGGGGGGAGPQNTTNNAIGGPSDAKKSKKKKVQTEKNVVVTEAKNVAGHRADIINDVDKLVEYIGGPESTGTKPKSNVHKAKPQKVVNSNSNTTESESKPSKKQRRAASLKSKTKTTSPDEISASVKSGDDEDEEEAAAAAAAAATEEVPAVQPTKSNNTMDVLEIVETVESSSAAEFRVVTKKKKSKKQQQRRNSISGQRTDAANMARIAAAARSVPHSEKSNDSSDIDSVHSLPVDTKRSNNNNKHEETEQQQQQQPISYATIAKHQHQQKVAVKKPKEKKVPILSTQQQQQQQTVAQGVQMSPKLQHSPPPPDVHNEENFPAIQQQQQQQQQQQKSVASVGQKVVATSGKVCKSSAKKGITAIPNKTVQLPKPPEEQNHPYLQNIQGDIQPMPPNITDVRTIEKMHFAQVQQQQQQLQQQQQQQIDNNNCDSVERTNSSNNNNNNSSMSPAVVIMNGEGGATTTREVSGIEFGFEINEKLLSDDVCDTFTAKFLSPPKVNTNLYNHEKIVSFIGQAWGDLVNSENVQYYSEDL